MDLLHISEIDWKKVAKVEDVLKEGQEVEVKIIDIDPKTGKIKLSRKDLLPRPPRQEPEKRNPQHRIRNNCNKESRKCGIFYCCFVFNILNFRL